MAFGAKESQRVVMSVETAAMVTEPPSWQISETLTWSGSASLTSGSAGWSQEMGENL